MRAFLQEGERQKAEAAEAVRNRKIGISNRHADRRVEAVNAFNKTREAKAVRAASEYATHAEILRARADAERREIEIEMALEEKERLARVAREEREGEEALRGLDAFEKNLSRNAAGRKASDESSGTSGLGIPGGSRRDPREHLAAMRASLPDPRAMQREGERTIRRIKSDRSEEALARKERGGGGKLDAERERAGAAAEARRREDELLATLAVKSKQETRVAERLSALERERDVMRDNRRDRDALLRGAAARGLGGGAAPRRRWQRSGARLTARTRLRRRTSTTRSPRASASAARMSGGSWGRGARYRRAGVPLRGVPRGDGEARAAARVPRVDRAAGGGRAALALPSREAEVAEGAEAVTGGARVVTRLDEANAGTTCAATATGRRRAARLAADAARRRTRARAFRRRRRRGRRRSRGRTRGRTRGRPHERDRRHGRRHRGRNRGRRREGRRREGGRGFERRTTRRWPAEMLGSAIFDAVATLPDACRRGCAAGRRVRRARAVDRDPLLRKSTAARKLAESRALVLIDPNELTREAVHRSRRLARRRARRRRGGGGRGGGGGAAAGEGEGDAPGDDAPHDVGEAVPASGTEPSAEADPPSEPRKRATRLAFEKNRFRFARAGRGGRRRASSGVRRRRAHRARGHPRPQAPARGVPAADHGRGPRRRRGPRGRRGGRRGGFGEEEPLSEPAEDAPDEEKAAFAAAAAERSARAAAKDAARSALRLEKETARQAEIESIDAAYAASVAELEATYPRPPGYVIDGFLHGDGGGGAGTRLHRLGRDARGDAESGGFRRGASREHELAARPSRTSPAWTASSPWSCPASPTRQAATLRGWGAGSTPRPGSRTTWTSTRPRGRARARRAPEAVRAARSDRRGAEARAWNDERELAKLEAWLAKFETEDLDDRFEESKDERAVTKTKHFENERDETADVESGEPTKPTKASTGVRVSVDARVSAGEVFLAVEAEATRVLDSKAGARRRGGGGCRRGGGGEPPEGAEAAEASASRWRRRPSSCWTCAKPRSRPRRWWRKPAAATRKPPTPRKPASAGDGRKHNSRPNPPPPPPRFAEEASEAVAAEPVRAAAAEAAQHADAEVAWWQRNAPAAAGARRRGGDGRRRAPPPRRRWSARGGRRVGVLRAAERPARRRDGRRADAAVAAADADDVAPAEAAAWASRDTDGAEAITPTRRRERDDAEGSPDENTTDVPLRKKIPIPKVLEFPDRVRRGGDPRAVAHDGTRTGGGAQRPRRRARG